jgi:hypothetical protein
LAVAHEISCAREIQPLFPRSNLAPSFKKCLVLLMLCRIAIATLTHCNKDILCIRIFSKDKFVP